MSSWDTRWSGEVSPAAEEDTKRPVAEDFKGLRNWLLNSVTTEGSPAEWAAQKAFPDFKSTNTAGIYAKEPDLSSLAIALQPVFHGTPHAWEGAGAPLEAAKGKTFDLSKMGSGEGAQAYGWGAYATKEPKIAEHYRETLSASPNLDTLADRWGNMPQPPETSLASRLARHFDDNGSRFATERGTRIEDMARRIGGKKNMIGNGDMAAYRFPDQSALVVTDGAWDIAQAADGEGRFYKLEGPEDSELLHYDKRFSEQPPEVQKKIEALIATRARDPEFAGFLKSHAKGSAIYNWLAEEGGESAASETLREAGIPGHLYRGDTSGVENMVIYDPARAPVTDAFHDLREYLASKGRE